MRHVAQLPLVGATMLLGARRAVEALPDDGHRPIVFVHGLGGGPGNFLPMRTWFRLHGRRRGYAIAFDAGKSMAALAPELGAFVEEVARVSGLPPGGRVDLVAHSMGGLVARMAVEAPRVAARVATLVTLGTPHGGTHAARYFNTERIRALRPGSDTMTRLRAQLPWRGPPEQPRLVSFWSDADVFMLPAGTARVENAESVEVHDLTHYGYLLSPATWSRVLATLASP